MEFRKFENLQVYKQSLLQLKQTWQFIDTSPVKNVFPLRDQLYRAALSIPLNISEGYGYTQRKFEYHLRVASGSANEVATIYSIIFELYGVDTMALQADYIYLARRLTLLRKKAHSF